MTIEFTCHECQHKLRTSDDKAGRTAACPSCGTELTVPPPGGGAPRRRKESFDIDDFEEDEVTSNRPSRSRGQECPMCGASVSQYDTKCSDCGESLSDRPRKKRRRRSNYQPHRGGLILGMSIGGFLCCVAINIATVIMGHQDLSAMKDGRMDPDGHGLTLAGVIIGWIQLGLVVLYIGAIIMVGIAENM